MLKFLKNNKYIIIACAILLAGSYGGYKYYQSTKVVANTVKIGTVIRGDLTETVSATGALTAMDNVDISSRIVYILSIIILIMNVFIISVITLLNMYDSKKEIALMRLIGIGMSKINLLYIIQNAFIGLASTVLAFLSSRLCLMLMREYVATMGIVLDATRFYSFEAVIMTLIFVISVLPTVICTLIMSGKDGISE